MDELATSFGRAAEAYERGRPGYQSEAVAWMLEPVVSDMPVRVLDIGAGTGKLTRVIVEAGHEVVALDPDPAMLERLRGTLSGVATITARAEEIPQADASFDAALAGQTWHWVEPVTACAEVGRVVKPGGVLGLVWNTRDTGVPWVARMSEIMHHSRAEEFIDNDEVVLHPPFETVERATLHRTRPMTRDRLFDMVHSRSYVITADPGTRAKVDRQLGELFDELGLDEDGEIELPYLTNCFRSIRTG